MADAKRFLPLQPARGLTSFRPVDAGLAAEVVAKDPALDALEVGVTPCDGRVVQSQVIVVGAAAQEVRLVEGEASCWGTVCATDRDLERTDSTVLQEIFHHFGFAQALPAHKVDGAVPYVTSVSLAVQCIQVLLSTEFTPGLPFLVLGEGGKDGSAFRPASGLFALGVSFQPDHPVAKKV
jgi:hypothetical protein